MCAYSSLNREKVYVVFGSTTRRKAKFTNRLNILKKFRNAAGCMVLLIIIFAMCDFTLHLQIRNYVGLTYCGRIAKVVITTFRLAFKITRNHI